MPLLLLLLCCAGTLLRLPGSFLLRPLLVLLQLSHGPPESLLLPLARLLRPPVAKGQEVPHQHTAARLRNMANKRLRAQLTGLHARSQLQAMQT